MDKLSGSEAIFGFCAWLTTRKKVTTMSSNHNAAPIVDLITQFCETNKLHEIRDHWADNLTPPKEEIDGS